MIGLPIAAAAIRSLSGVIETALTTTMFLSLDNPRGQRHSVPLHRAVYDAIRDRDPVAAQAAMMRLIDDAEEDANKALKLGRRRNEAGKKRARK